MKSLPFPARYTLITLLALAPTAQAQRDASSRLHPTVPAKYATKDLKTGAVRVQKNAPHAALGANLLYNNTCATGFFAGMSPGDVFLDNGQIPGTTNTLLSGCQDQYTADGFQFAYCTDQSSVDLLLTFHTLHDSCTDITGVPGRAFNITGLPGSPTGIACWVLTVDLAGTSLIMTFQADGDGLYDGTDDSDTFGFTYQCTNLTGTVGPVIAGNPVFLDQGCDFAVGTIFELQDPTQSSPGGTGYGSTDRFGLMQGGAYAGCFFFGGWPGNVWSSYHMQLFTEDVCTPPSTGFCFGGQEASCPCGNDPAAGSMRGCLSSSGEGARLEPIAGEGSCGLQLRAYDLPPSNGGIFLVGNAVGSAVQVFDGLYCIGGSTLRLGAGFETSPGERISLGGAGSLVLEGELASPGYFTIGVPYYFQYWFRDVAAGLSPCGTSANFTNAIEAVFTTPWGDPCDGVDCDDGDPCTIDTCVEGVCVNTPIDCDDEDPCTTDYCLDGVCYNDPIPVEGYEPGCQSAPLASPECEPCKKGDSCGLANNYNGNLYAHSGEATTDAVDLSAPGVGLDVQFSRKYRSQLGPNSAVGTGWDFGYDIQIERCGDSFYVCDGNSRRDLYQPITAVSGTTGHWHAEELFRELSLELDGTYKLTFPNRGSWQFHPMDGSNTQGKLSAIEDRNGNRITLLYDAAGRLATLRDTLLRDTTLQYDGAGRLVSVTDFAGRSTLYEYYGASDPGGPAGSLKAVTTPAVVSNADFPVPAEHEYPTGKTTTYTYSKGFGDSRLNNNLLTITDAKGQTWLQNVYATTTNPNDIEFDRVVRQILGDAGDIIDYTYSLLVPSAGNNFATQKTTINDRVGNVSERYYDTRNRIVVLREYTGRANPDQPTDIDAGLNVPTGPLRGSDPAFFETRWQYNEDSLVTQITHPNGTYETFIYDESNADRRGQANLLMHCRLPGTHTPAGDQAQICESFEYDNSFGGCCGTNFATKYTDAKGNETLYTLDSNGNRLHVQHRLPSIIEDWEYNAAGQVTAHVHPDNGSGHRRRDEFTYYTSGPSRGYMHTSRVDAGFENLTTTYEYNIVGQVTRRVEPSGKDTLFIVNQLDQIVRQLSPEISSGSGLRYVRDHFYDLNDNLARTDVQNVDHLGVVSGSNPWITTIHEFDTLDQPVRTCMEVGSFDVTRTPLQLDCSGLPAADFIQTEKVYDANRDLTLIRGGSAVAGTDPFHTVRILLDERRLTYRVVRAEGSADQSTTQLDYDGNGNLVTTREGLEASPHVTAQAYDGYNRLVSSTDPMGNVTSHAYDPNGNAVHMIVEGELNDLVGSAGNVRLYEQSFAYDDMDRNTSTLTEYFETSSQSPLQGGQQLGRSIITQTWTPSSQLASATNDNGHQATYAYDTAKRRSLATDAAGNSIGHTYDLDSNIVQVTTTEVRPDGNPPDVYVSSLAYDGLDRLIQTTDPIGNSQGFAYDSRSNTRQVIDALGNVTNHGYDGLDRLTSTTYLLTNDGTGSGSPAGQVHIVQDWDASSRLVSRTDGMGNTTSFQYDSLGRVVTKSFEDCTFETRSYDVHDNLILTTDANGSSVASTFDALHRVTAKAITPGAGVSNATTIGLFQYDGMSRIVRAEDDDSIVAMSYTSLSNISSETLTIAGQATTTVTTTHDGNGNAIECLYPGGRMVTTTFDALERKSVISDQTGALATYAYIGPDRVFSRLYTNNTGLYYEHNGVVNAPGDFGVRQVSRTTHLLDPLGAATVLDDRSYRWGPMQNKRERQDLRAGGPQLKHTYSLDSLYRLIETDVQDGLALPVRNTTYAFDAANNRLSVGGMPDAGTYTYDMTSCEPADGPMNQPTSTPFDTREYDSNGNLIRIDNGLPTQRDLVYDYRNQLVEITMAATGQVHTYGYDPFGRRVRKTLDSNTAPDTTHYYYSGWNVVEEQDALGATQATYVYGSYADEVLTMRRGVLDYYYHADDMHNVVAVTDAAGVVVERCEYQDYGDPDFLDATGNVSLGVSASTIDNPYLFTGRRFDPETGFYYYRSRYLDPRAGQFLTRDVIGLWGDGGNLGNGRSYVWNNPATGLDPSGMSTSVSFIGGLEDPGAFRLRVSMDVHITEGDDGDCCVFSCDQSEAIINESVSSMKSSVSAEAEVSSLLGGLEVKAKADQKIESEFTQVFAKTFREESYSDNGLECHRCRWDVVSGQTKSFYVDKSGELYIKGQYKLVKGKAKISGSVEWQSGIKSQKTGFIQIDSCCNPQTEYIYGSVDVEYAGIAANGKKTDVSTRRGNDVWAEQGKDFKFMRMIEKE